MRPLALLAALLLAAAAAALSLRPEPPVPDEPISGAARALVLWNQQRAYPAVELPAEGLVQAVAAVRDMAAGRRAETTEPWQALGPTNIGGRTLAIEVNADNPDAVWIGSAGGGLWRSYAGGVGGTWERVETGFPVTSAPAVEIAPSDTARVYLGTGEVYRYADAQGGVVNRPTRGSYGLGILRSDDGGQTWAPSLDWSRDQGRGIQRIKVHPSSADLVWAATTEGVYKSTDGGATWANVHPVVMAMDIVLRPSDPDWAIAAHGDQESAGQGIYRTTDGGATWTQLTAGVPTGFIGKIILDIEARDERAVWASVGDGIYTSQPTATTLVRSADGGDTWQTVSTFDYARYQGWFSHFARVSPLVPDLVFLGGVDFYRSLNGGASTTGGPADVHSDNHDLAFHPTDPDVAWLVGDGGVYKTTNRGASWTDENAGYTTLQLYNGTSVSATDPDVMLGGAQDNGTWRYGGSPAWDKVFGGDGAWTAIDPENDGRFYYSYQRLNFYRNSTYISPPGSNLPTAFIAPYVLAPSEPNRLYAGRDRVYRSANYGDSWTAGPDLGTNAALALAVSPTNADVVWVTTAPTFFDGAPEAPTAVHVSSDGGVTWADRTAGLPDRMFMDAAVDPADDDTAYLVASGFGAGHVFKTTDGGLSWTDLTGDLPDVPASAVALDPLAPGTVYVGNDVGVFVSQDGGLTWAPYADGMPSAALVTDLVVSPSDGTLRVATHGNGFFSRELLRDPVSAAGGPAGGLELAAPSPNPVRGATTLRYRLAAGADVELVVYDLRGRRVAVLAEGARAAGEHAARFDARGLAPGRYVVRLQAGGATRRADVTVVR